MTTRPPVFFDRTGKPPATPEKLRLEAAERMKTVQFFAALRFTVEKHTTTEGRKYVLARPTHVELSIIPLVGFASRTFSPPPHT